jgi:ribosome assembly protein YihI (activator of Der GTPase)
MTRQKNSRKVAEIRVRSKETRDEKPTENRRKKTPKGQKAGTRNSLVEEQKTAITGSNIKKDPKHGSKKPISLTGSPVKEVIEKEISHSTSKPAGKLSKAKVASIPPDVELTDIESDEVLIALVERVEDGELLAGKEAKYFNKLMDRHAELLRILGVEDEEENDFEDEIDPVEGLKSDQWDDLLDEEK